VSPIEPSRTKHRQVSRYPLPLARRRSKWPRCDSEIAAFYTADSPLDGKPRLAACTRQHGALQAAFAFSSTCQNCHAARNGKTAAPGSLRAAYEAATETQKRSSLISLSDPIALGVISAKAHLDVHWKANPTTRCELNGHPFQLNPTLPADGMDPTRLKSAER